MRCAHHADHLRWCSSIVRVRGWWGINGQSGAGIAINGLAVVDRVNIVARRGKAIAARFDFASFQSFGPQARLGSRALLGTSNHENESGERYYIDSNDGYLRNCAWCQLDATSDVEGYDPAVRGDKDDEDEVVPPCPEEMELLVRITTFAHGKWVELGERIASSNEYE